MPTTAEVLAIIAADEEEIRKTVDFNHRQALMAEGALQYNILLAKKIRDLQNPAAPSAPDGLSSAN